jgi:DNA mismatch repair protein MutL
LLGKGDWSGALREVLDSAEGKTDWREKAAVSLACHGAVRAGQILSDDEMRELVRQLEKTSSPHTCPHGRPTLIHLSSGQLSKEFGR